MGTTTTINRDGSYTDVVGEEHSPEQSRSLNGSSPRGKGNEPGNTETYHSTVRGENELLIYRSDDGAVSAELRPVTNRP